MLTIGITTFKRRLKSVEDMIIYLKSCDKDIKAKIEILKKQMSAPDVTETEKDW